MSIIESESGADDHSSVKRKSNNTRKLSTGGRKKTSRTAGSAPEVMAKVTGFSKGASHAKSNIDYIARNGDVALENERGEVISGRQEIKSFAKEWVAEFGDGKRYKDQRDTMHLIMSMPEGTDPEAVRRATRQFAKQTFGKNNEYVFALHTDTASPHTHITVKTLGYDGKRLNPRKDDLQRYRESFADAMEQQGYMANATGRSTRGVVKKAQRQAIIHIDKRGQSIVKAQKVKDAAQELVAENRNNPVKAKPWVDKIKATQDRVRSAWLTVADKLQNSVEREIENERPNYGRRTDGRRTSDVRGLAEQLRQRGVLAGVHQSGYRASGGTGPTESVTSMRNLSGSPLVQKQAASEMLLHKNALNLLANRNGRRTDNDMRRSGAGLTGDGGSNAQSRGKAAKTEREKVTRSMATRMTDKELAETIKAFVAKMPALETERDQIKQSLKAKFAKPMREQAVRTSTVEPTQVPSENADRELDR